MFCMLLVSDGRFSQWLDLSIDDAAGRGPRRAPALGMWRSVEKQPYRIDWSHAGAVVPERSRSGAGQGSKKIETGEREEGIVACG